MSTNTNITNECHYLIGVTMNWESTKERVLLVRDNILSRIGGGIMPRSLFFGTIAYLVIAVFVGMYWSGMPSQFSVSDNATQMSESAEQSVVIGATTTATLIRVTSTMMDKPGVLLVMICCRQVRGSIILLTGSMAC